MKMRWSMMGLLLLILASPPAHATPVEEPGWELILSPYLWGSRMHGEVEMGRLPPVDVAMSFGDILKQLDGGFMGAMELRHGRWGLLFDSLYMNTSASVSQGGINADVGVRQTQLAGLLAWRWQEGAVPVDLLAGVRHMRLAQTLALNGAVEMPEREQKMHWSEPVLGLRARWPLTPDWSLWGAGDVGGFGVGSDLTLQALLGMSYAVTPRLAAELGVRWIKVDYDEDALRYDMVNDGLFMGVSYRF